MFIAAAGNTMAPAYFVLVSKGYAVSRKAEKTETWLASRGEISCTADDLLQLLGLVVMAETRGERWHASDGELGEFLRKFNLG